MTRAAMFLAVVAGVVLAGRNALATHNEPKSAKKVQGTFVTAYAACTVPNDTAGGFLPACHPPVRSDPSCGFGPKGSGQYQLQPLSKGDVGYQFKLTGLETPGCVGKTLQLAVTLRITTHACASGGGPQVGPPPNSSGCTTVDLSDFPAPGATCTVNAKGICGPVNSSADAHAPGIIGSGADEAYEFFGVNLFDASTCGPASCTGGTKEFQGGILVP